MNNYRTCGIIGDVEGTRSAAFCLPVKRPTYVSCAVPSTSRQTHRRGVLCLEPMMTERGIPTSDVIDRWIGRRFGRMVVTGYYGRTSYNAIMWMCRCDCGAEKPVSGKNLSGGRVLSCGCYSKERSTRHGQSYTRTYSIWTGMIQRCVNPRATEWENYGARGISVCEEWGDFANFYSDMGDCPDGLTLDRINVNGNYEPSNCRWATYREQARNRRNNVTVLFMGEERCLSDLAAELGIPVNTMFYRYRNGWSIERLVKQPNYKKRVSGEEKS